jgi:hypothetical protein
MTCRISLVAACCSSASASRFSASAKRFSGSRALEPSFFGDLRASARLASAFTFAGFARRPISFSPGLPRAAVADSLGEGVGASKRTAGVR